MNYEVINGDAIEQMRAMPAESVDCVVTDPPYGDTKCPWDTIVCGWLDECRRILKPSGSAWFFTSIRHLVAIAELLDGWKIAQDIIWEKHNGSGPCSDRFLKVHEIAVQIYPKPRQWRGIYRDVQKVTDPKAGKMVRRAKPGGHRDGFRNHEHVSNRKGLRLSRSVIQVRSCQRRAIHPTQKPEDIVRPLVRYSCPPGGVVLDCFAGSGTTGVVCVQEQRRFIGIEKDPEMADKARARIATEVANGRQQSIEGVA